MRTFSSRSPWQRAYAAASSRGRRRSRFRRSPHVSATPTDGRVAAIPAIELRGRQFATEIAIALPRRPSFCPRAPACARAARKIDEPQSLAPSRSPPWPRADAHTSPSGTARGTDRLRASSTAGLGTVPLLRRPRWATGPEHGADCRLRVPRRETSRASRARTFERSTAIVFSSWRTRRSAYASFESTATRVLSTTEANGAS